MATLDQLTTGLHPALAAKLVEFRSMVRAATKPYDLKDEYGHLVKTIEPLYELRVRVGAPKELQVTLEYWKPVPAKRVVAEFAGDQYDAIGKKIHELAVSWESYFEQVVQNG